MRYTRVLPFIMLIFLAGCASIPLATLKQKYAGDGSRFVEIDGMQVHYRDEGDGPVLILVHGMLASLHTWDGWVNQIGDHYRIIRLDLPAFGLTGPAHGWEDTEHGRYVRMHYVDFMVKFMDALNIEKAHFAGNSIGGFVSWSLAAYHPERVDKLILIDSVGYPLDAPWVVDVVATPVLGSCVTCMTPKFLYKMNIKEVYGDEEKVTDELVERYYELSLAPGTRQASRELITEMKRNSVLVQDGIDRIKSPVLIMWGSVDSWIPVEQAQLWKRDVSSASVKIYEGAGHVPMEEMPVQTAEDAHRFLSGDY